MKEPDLASFIHAIGVRQLAVFSQDHIQPKPGPARCPSNTNKGKLLTKLKPKPKLKRSRAEGSSSDAAPTNNRGQLLLGNKLQSTDKKKKSEYWLY